MPFPAARPSWLRPILVANLAAEVLIVVTGGAVRLTGSGLGCPTWPECVPGSIAPVVDQAEGFHKYIEFGNRLLTGVVGILALLALWAVWTRLPHRRVLRWLAIGMVVGVLIQAVMGGITVRTGLHPLTVAAHFLLSMVMIALATMMLRGARDTENRPRTLLVRPLVAKVGWLTLAVGAVVFVLGTIVTGSGPHSGDADTPARTGFDPRFVSWLHADSVMLFCGLVVAMLVGVYLSKDGEPARASWRGVLVVTLLQGAIGYVQYFTKLPEILVGAHMLGASLLVVALTIATMNLWRDPLGSRPGPLDPVARAHDHSARQRPVEERVDRYRDEEHRDVADGQVEQPHGAAGRGR